MSNLLNRGARKKGGRAAALIRALFLAACLFCVTATVHAEEAEWAYGVDPALLAKMAFCESSGRPWIVSRSGHLGLLQFSSSTWTETQARSGITGPWWDEETQLEMGAWLISQNEIWRWNASRRGWG